MPQKEMIHPPVSNDQIVKKKGKKWHMSFKERFYLIIYIFWIFGNFCTSYFLKNKGAYDKR